MTRSRFLCDCRRYAFTFMGWFYRTFCGYKEASEDPFQNLPNVGDICLVQTGVFRIVKGVFKEHPLNVRMSEDRGRYYFETLDGYILNIMCGINYKKINMRQGK